MKYDTDVDVGMRDDSVVVHFGEHCSFTCTPEAAMRIGDRLIKIAKLLKPELETAGRP
jgi:hypothetical protein